MNKPWKESDLYTISAHNPKNKQTLLQDTFQLHFKCISYQNKDVLIITKNVFKKMCISLNKLLKYSVNLSLKSF